MMNADENNIPKEGDELSWRVHPLTESVKRSVMVIGIIVLFCSVVHLSFGELFWTILSLVFLLASLSPYFLPTVYTLNDKEVIVKRILTTKRLWTSFRGFYWDQNGVQLSPFTYPSRLDAYRGLFLRFGDNKEEVLEFIKKHLPKADPKKPEESDKVDE